MKAKDKNISSFRTKEKIKSSFLKILGEKKDIEKIKVKEIVQDCGIDRTTFYLHYSSVYDIAQFYVDELNSKFFLDELPETIEEVKAYVHEIVVFAETNKYIYSMILSSDSPVYYFRNLSNKFKKLLLDILRKYRDDEYLEMDVDFVVNGLKTVLMGYFRNFDFDINHIEDIYNDQIKWILSKNKNTRIKD